jgi:diguanylate cyclase (GGDEF)-like protein
MHNDQLYHQKHNAFPRRMAGFVVLVGLVVAVLIASSYRLGSDMIERYTPLIDAVMEIQLHATTSHLWFEEILSNDMNEKMSQVYLHLDMADKYAVLMLSGGEYDGLAYMPLQDEAMIAQVHTVRDDLSQFRDIVDQRWQMRDSSGPGSALDQRFDAVFDQLINDSDALEVHLQAIIHQALRRFYIANAMLLAVAVTITIVAGWMIRRFMLRQAYVVHLLERTNLELTSEVEKRKRTEALLEKQASTDHLTGILNRSRMTELLEEEWERVGRYAESFSLIMFDLDHFKRINDQHGHQIGDKALVEVTHRVKRELRGIDAFSRWGGEEFLILLPRTELVGANEVAERCRESLVSEPVDEVGIITASFGVVEYQAEDGTLQRLLQRADAALYEAKRAGRDCIRDEGA